MMHIAWFANFTVDAWSDPFGNGGQPWDGRFYVEMAQALERACFDFVMFEDKLSVPDVYGGNHNAYLKHALGMVPKGDPVPLATLVSAMTSRIGVVATMSTMAWPPFMLARAASTIDSISGGRFGWNIVTSAEDSAAQNFGMDVLPPREERYERADEYMDLVTQLWQSWDPDAIICDRETGTYADGTKVHAINFEGRFFKCKGPLNSAPSPQIIPTLVQAGGSPAGRDFAAKFADAIVSAASDIEGMKEFRADVRARAVAHGRNPDDIKVLFLAAPALGATTAEAEAVYDSLIGGENFIERKLAGISAITGIDFSLYDLDQPLPGRLMTNGEQGTLDAFQQHGSGKTLREIVTGSSSFADSVKLVGTPDEVAAIMGEVMAEVGGDGFLLTTATQTVSRRQIAEICDGLVPALQRRGLVRTGYGQPLLRGNLRSF